MFHHQFFFFFFSLTSSRTIRFVSYARFCDSRSRRKIEPARSSVGFRRARFSGFGFSFLFVDDAHLPRRCEYSLHSSPLLPEPNHVRVVSKPFVYVVEPKLSQDIADFLHRELFHVSFQIVHFRAVFVQKLEINRASVLPFHGNFLAESNALLHVLFQKLFQLRMCV